MRSFATTHPLACLSPAAVRLFYWTRLAYRNDKALDYKYLNAATACRLFDLDQHCTVCVDRTDTHCVLGWSSTRVVLAFRWAGLAACWMSMPLAELSTGLHNVVWKIISQQC